MRFNKPATTINEQLTRLQARGMIFGSADHARRCLESVGYYRLSAYWLPFEARTPPEQTRSKRFRDNTCFEQVMELYVFDRKLRVLCMEAIERIEIHLRSCWTHRMVLAHSTHAHIDANLFSNSRFHAARLSRLKKSVTKSDELFITHYRRRYLQPDMPPLWAVTELMTFSELSKWVEDTKDHGIKDGIARDMAIPNKNLLVGIIQALAYVRNLCAHHARFWNRRLVMRMPLVKRWRDDFAIETHAGQTHPVNLVYNVLIVILHLLRHQNVDTSFPSRLRELIESVDCRQRVAMGFPDQWRERPIWQQLRPD